MKNMASRTNKKKIIQLIMLCSLGMMNQVRAADLPLPAPANPALAAALQALRALAAVPGLSPKQIAKLIHAVGDIFTPKPKPTFIGLMLDLPNTVNEKLGESPLYAVPAFAGLAVVGYAGYCKLASNGPVTIKARDIEARITCAVDSINLGINRKNKAPLRQIADTLKGILELRLVLDDAICGLPEKYNDLTFLQQCCDQIDTMLRNPDIAYTYRYVAQQDRALQTLITNVHDSILAKLSFEHLMGLHQSIQGKPVSTLGNIAEIVQWMRNGFDPVHAPANSLSIASRVLTQTVRNGVQAVAGSSLALQKREDQMKVLNHIRSLLVSSSDAQKTWFEKLRDWTGVSKFLRLCIISKKTSGSSASSVSTIDQDQSTVNAREESRINNVAGNEIVPVSSESNKDDINNKYATAVRAMPLHKYLVHVIMQQAHKHSLLTNVVACTTLCAVIALGVRNYQLIGNKITATTTAVYQRAKAASARCLARLKLSSHKNLAATA